MIYRKPTVIQIKQEEDMLDIQPQPKPSLQMGPNLQTPSNHIKGRLEDLRNQMEIERNSHSHSHSQQQSHSPYSSEIFNQLLSNIRDEHQFQ